ncbi:hypothetical protein [Kerstersia sp.]|uniref:hypothetical protein n=1 Tax=Kerstersia sp. TaxID=1930783 RepID=UPI003F8EC12C
MQKEQQDNPRAAGPHLPGAPWQGAGALAVMLHTLKNILHQNRDLRPQIKNTVIFHKDKKTPKTREIFSNTASHPTG